VEVLVVDEDHDAASHNGSSEKPPPPFHPEGGEQCENSSTLDAPSPNGETTDWTSNLIHKGSRMANSISFINWQLLLRFSAVEKGARLGAWITAVFRKERSTWLG
jgi:hypothetical protein